MTLRNNLDIDRTLVADLADGDGHRDVKGPDRRRFEFMPVWRIAAIYGGDRVGCRGRLGTAAIGPLDFPLRIGSAQVPNGKGRHDEQLMVHVERLLRNPLWVLH